MEILIKVGRGIVPLPILWYNYGIMIKEINMKNICVITGASSGIGKEFFMSLAKDSDFNFDEIWAIARSEERLAALGALCDIPVKAIPLDLSREESYAAYEKLLSDEEVNVSLLVNCSGFGNLNRPRRWVTTPRSI